MTTKTINLYEFQELSDKAKQRARDWWRECEAQEFGSFGELYEPIETAARLLGIEFKRRDVPLMSGKNRSEPCVWWQLHVQGSGASFEGTYAYVKGSVRQVRAEFPEDKELQRIASELAKLQKQDGYQLTATITTSGREVHQYAMSVDTFDKHGREVDWRTDLKADVDVLEVMRDFATWIYKYIDAEYTYRMSDENVDDAIRANEYTFTVDGERERARRMATTTKKQAKPEKRVRVSCSQCQMLSINGVACHEHGCPNSRSKWIDGQWVKVRECAECGCEVLADEPCCTGEES